METPETTIAKINRSNSEAVFVSLDDYKGQQVLNIRVWVDVPEKGWIPTRRGINLYPNELPDLEAALQRIKEEIAESKPA